MSNQSMRFKIYGIRGSYPPTAGFPTHFGVNTTCFRFDVGPHVVVLDAGTGIINLGADLLKEAREQNGSQNPWRMFIFFTHLHIDHLMGFPYLPQIYFPQSEIHLISPKIVNYSLADALEMLMSPALFPVTLDELQSTRIYHDFAENRVAYFTEEGVHILPSLNKKGVDKWILKVSAIRNYTHPKGGAYVYKFETPAGNSVVIATDVEGFIGGDQRIINFAKGASILVHDAQYTLPEYAMFQGFGHSTYEMACHVAKEAGVQKLLLFHHDPKHDDAVLSELEAAAQKIFPETYMAAESMEFTLK